MGMTLSALHKEQNNTQDRISLRTTPERLADLGLTDCAPDQPFGPMPDD